MATGSLSGRSPRTDLVAGGPPLRAFAPDIAAELGGPDWLRRRRAEAATAFEAMALPTAEDEVWRYSRVGELDLASFTPQVGAPDGAAPAVDGVASRLTERAGLAVVADGHVIETSVSPAAQGVGLEVTTLSEARAGDRLLDDEPTAVDAFDHLNTAFGPDPVLVRIPPGAVIDDPVVVVHAATVAGSASFPRLIVAAGADSQATIVEIHESSADHALVVPVADYRVGQAARLSAVVVQDLGRAVWQIARQISTVEAGGTFSSAGAVLGGDYARLRTDCRLTGRGAEGTLLAAYLGDGEQMLDFRTFQDHAAPDTTSELLFKGALGGAARSVYTGLIRVRPEGRGTNAFQTNRNLKISESAWAESVPNLEIENNEVQCSHASTVGPVDEEQRFYLESRGVPPDRAERLIVSGFFDEVVERIGLPEIEEWLLARLRADLERELG